MGEHVSSNLGKWESGNPVVQALLRRYLATLGAIVAPLRPTSILDVGAGEGMAAGHLHALLPDVPYKGIDLSAGAVADARRRHPDLVFEQGSVLALPGEHADVVLCLEVLEHLDDPGAAIDQLHAACGRHVVVSVPWEPWFRLGNLARGKYLGRLGNHPEHVQQLGPASLARLVGRRFGDVHVVTSFPWVFAWASRA